MASRPTPLTLALLVRVDVMLLACLAILPACRETPTEPVKHTYPVYLLVYCNTNGHNVSCTARLFNVPSGADRDVTLQATWMASDMSVGTYVQPGLFVPARRGEVTLWARFETFEARVQHSFLVDPMKDAQWLYYVTGAVRDQSTQAPISGADVTILDGYAQGAHSTTDANGIYEIDRLLTGQVVTAVASKPSYTPSILSHRVDSPIGVGNPPVLNFYLRRSP